MTTVGDALPTTTYEQIPTPPYKKSPTFGDWMWLHKREHYICAAIFIILAAGCIISAIYAGKCYENHTGIVSVNTAVATLLLFKATLIISYMMHKERSLSVLEKYSLMKKIEKYSSQRKS